MAYKSFQKSNTKRDKEIILYHQKGLSLSQIGRIYDISRQRVFIIIKRELAKVEQQIDKPPLV